MKLEFWKDEGRAEQHYHLILQEFDIVKVPFDKCDITLMNEVQTLKNPPVSDILLVLEMICRKIESRDQDKGICEKTKQ